MWEEIEVVGEYVGSFSRLIFPLFHDITFSLSTPCLFLAHMTTIPPLCSCTAQKVLLLTLLGKEDAK